MSWQSTTLADSMAGITAAANGAISEVQSGLNKLDNQVSKLKSNVSTAVSAISATKSTLDKLTESGFYMITLSPKTGVWSSRISVAANAPPADLNYSCGTAVIVVAPDLSTVETAYQGILDAVKKPMADASNIVDKFDFTDFIAEATPNEFSEIDEEEMAAQDWSDLFETDVWKSTTLKDVFGGYAEGLAKATNKLSKAAKSVLATVNQASRASSAISRGLTATKTLLTKMEGTGVYTITLEPGKGSVLQRLTSEEGAPPTTSGYVSAGYVCVAVAADVSSLTTKYEALSKIVSGT